MLEIAITETIKLDCCWVCSLKNGLEDHHVVPRAYGGQNGPTVTLCGICHSSIDKLSYLDEIFEEGVDDQLVLIRSYFFCQTWREPKRGTSYEAVSKAFYLAMVIRNSRELMQPDENRKMVLMIALDPNHAKKFRKLCQVFGMSQKRTTLQLIDYVYNREVGG